jgi:hypothetical protein
MWKTMNAMGLVVTMSLRGNCVGSVLTAAA